MHPHFNNLMRLISENFSLQHIVERIIETERKLSIEHLLFRDSYRCVPKTVIHTHKRTINLFFSEFPPVILRLIKF